MSLRPAPLKGHTTTSSTTINQPKSAAYQEVGSGAPVSGSDHQSPTTLHDEHDRASPWYRRVKWKNWAPFPIAGAAYLIHARFRRYAPRILRPAFTPLSLRELYATSACLATYSIYEDAKIKKAIFDRDGLTIFAGSFIARGVLDEIKRLDEMSRSEIKQAEDQAKLAQKAAQIMKDLKENRLWIRPPETNSFITKTVRAYYGLWCDNVAWSHCISQIFKPPSKDDTRPIPNLSRADAHNLIMHLANACQGPNQLVAFHANRVLPFWGAFLGITPFAMLARWTGRRLLFLPLNGLQRVLFYAILFVATTQRFQVWNTLTSIEDKFAAAELVERAFPGCRALADDFFSNGPPVFVISSE